MLNKFWPKNISGIEKGESKSKSKMAVMERLRMFVAQEPVVAASCLIAGFGISLFLDPNLPLLDHFILLGFTVYSFSFVYIQFFIAILEI